MLYTIVGDPHCRPDNLDLITKVFEQVEALGNPVIILGDLFDTKELIRGRCLNLVFKLLQQSSLQWIILCGNHDLFTADGEDSSLTVLDSLDNVRVVSEPDGYRAQDGTLMHFMPYRKYTSESFAELTQGLSGPLFGHFDIQTFDYGNGIASQEGLTIEDFKVFTTVISGHYHRYQQRGNITYLGTPFSHSFGESNQEKFLGLFDTESWELELIPMTLPRHMTYQQDAAEPHVMLNSADINRVIVKGTFQQLAAFERLPGVKYLYEETRQDTAQETLSEELSNEQQFQAWAKDIASLDDSTVALGMEILQHVQKN